MKKQRFDSAKITARFDSNGYLHDEPIIARIGVQIYHKQDGTVQREFRPANEVFKDDTLNAFRGMPIVSGHKEVTPKNAKGLVVGACSGAGFREDVGMRCPVVVHDGEAIERAKKGDAAEISVGYTTNDIHRAGWGNSVTGEYVFKDDAEGMSRFENGVIDSDWEEFDVLQTNITPNHVALVPQGRAGIARLNLDGSQELKYDEHEFNNPRKENTMTVKVIKIDAVDVEVPIAVATHIETISAQLIAAGQKADGLEAERDALKVKVDGIDKIVSDAIEAEKAKNDELVALIATASEIGIKCDGLDAKAIKIEYISEVLGIDAKDKNDAYIDVSFENARDSDKMAANRIKINGGGDGKKGKEDGKDDNGIVDPQARFRKK